MKIQLIDNLSQLDDGQFLEIFPGPYKGRSWNDESVYVEDEAFSLIEPVVTKHAPQFNRRSNNNNIEKDAWTAIVADLETLRGQLEKATSINDIQGVVGFQEETSREFAKDLEKNLASLNQMIGGLTQWLNRELESKPVICILGI